MRQLCKNLLLPTLMLLLSGCASNYYNVPRETYEKKVRVLGVAPLLLDTDSDIRHPEKAEVLKLIREANRKNEKELVEIIKGSGEYFSVRFLEEDADQLYTTIVSRRERRDDAGIIYNKYFYKPEEIKKFITRHNVDAVLLVTVSGISTLEKIYASNFMAFLEDYYNDLIMTGQILDSDSALLWEYPNFRQRMVTFSPLFALQYPDFEESRANLIDQVKIKNKSLDGIGRALAKSESASGASTRQVSILYNRQFTEMASFLQYFRNPFADKKAETRPVEPPKMEEPARLAPPPAVTPPVTQPVTPPPAQLAPPKPLPRPVEPVKLMEPATQIIMEPEIK